MTPGREAGFHQLRHHYASLVLAVGVDIRTLAEYLRTHRPWLHSQALLPPAQSAMLNGLGHPARRSFGDDDLWTDAGLIAVGEPTVEERLDKALTKAAKVVKRTVEATTDEITSDLQEALKS